MKKRAKHSKAKSKRRPAKRMKAKRGNGSTLKATELLRDIMNLIAVYKKEAKRDVTTRIDPDTAEELMEKLEKVAKSL